MLVSFLGLSVACVVSAGPPVRDAADAEVVGVVWHEQATGPSPIRQRVLEALAVPTGPDSEPPTILDRADDRARAGLAVALPRERADNIVRLAQGLNDATTRFREGDLLSSEAAVLAVLAALRDDPLLPGAVGLAVSAEVLHAQILWSTPEVDGGGEAAATEALRRAVALDPDAALSTRRVPPAIAALHASVRAQTLATQAAWLPILLRRTNPPTGRTAPTAPTMVEIDGRPGRRLVPPGEHFVVVRTPGRRPLGFVVEAGGVIDVPEQPEEIAVGLPADDAAATVICDHTGAARLVLVTLRTRRLAMESFACGEGFGAVRYSEPFEPIATDDADLGPPDPWLTAAALAMGRSRSGEPRPRSRLAAGTPWPKPKPPPDRDAPKETDETTPPPAKPWYKRVWVWSLIGGVVVAGVTAGAVLGTREQPPVVQIDTDMFFPPQ